jgi:uncharacterized protein YndB with AHSA1/START domain
MRKSMPSATRSITVDRPIDEVFEFFTDPANERRWRTHVKEISAEGPVAVGTRIHQVIAGPAGRGIAADLEVTRYERPTDYAFQVVAGPVRPRGEFRFTPVGDATTVSLSLAAELNGLKKLLLTRSVQRSMDGEMRALDRAKAFIEGP